MSRIISIVGAGGKTSIMLYLAGMYDRLGQKNIITTTTHIMKPAGIPYVDSGLSVDEVKTEITVLFDNVNTVCTAKKNTEGKLCAPGEEIFRLIFDMDIPIIIEADGSKRLPIKVPDKHEPVINSRTDTVYAVIGADSIGKTISEAGFRVERMCELLGKEPVDIIDVYDLVKIYTSERGLRKSIPEKAEYLPVLSKVDCELYRKYALETGKLLKDGYNLNLITANHGVLKNLNYF